MAQRLGKKPHKYDPRTLSLGPLMAPPMAIPATFDFDKNRAPLPVSSWGNDQWGNCVVAGRANQTVRQQRVETRRTIPLSPVHVIEEYKRLSGAIQPDDANDNGLVVLYAMRDWRTDGWLIPRSAKKEFVHKISAYGELNAKDREQLRTAIFLFHGIHFGIGLPLTARAQWRSNTAWDVVQGDTPEHQPWSWGGHLVYAKRFDSGGIYCLTWGKEVYMTNTFIEKYADEAWVTVDDLDTHSRWLDVPALINLLREIGAWRIE
jgi:hypothetical protein